MLKRIVGVLRAGPRYTLARAYSFVFPARAKCAPRLPTLLAGKGLEVGGPTRLFETLVPVYGFAELDNCNFHTETLWEGRLVEGRHFRYGSRTGEQFIREASDLRFADASYDFVISSHALEHCANPIKVLKEWRRVLKRHLLLVLPEGRRTITSDRERPVTPLEHMVEDYQRDVGEDDLTHTDDRTNVTHRMLHHHVFDEGTATALVERSAFRVLSVETLRPFHIVILAEKA